MQEYHKLEASLSYTETLSQKINCCRIGAYFSFVKEMADFSHSTG
jgi:hypothetical protein